MSFIFQTGAPPAQCTTNPTEALLRACPILQTALTCPPNQIFSHILALSKLTHEEQSPFRKYKTLRVEVTEPLIEQFKKVTEWSIDHLDLFRQLQKISEFIRLEIERLYEEVLLSKVNNGLQMMQIISNFTARIRYSPKGFVKKEIKKSYEVLKGYSGNSSQESIYTLRFMMLNEEERLRYKIKLMKYSPNVTENDMSKMYQLLQTSEYEWLLQELLTIQSPKSKEYKRMILSLKLEVENEAVILSRHPKINYRFINNKSLNSSLEIENQLETCALSFGEVLEHNNQIYLKFDITEISSEILAFLESIGQQSRTIFTITRHTFDRANAEGFFQEVLRNIKKIIYAALYGMPIYYYLHNQRFNQMAEEKIFETLLVCLKVLKSVISIGEGMRIIHVIDRHLTNLETIKLFNQVLCFFQESTKPENQQKAFLLVCQIIQSLVMKNPQKIAIMNNPEFLNILVDNTNKIINRQEANDIPVNLQQFLIQYIPYLVSFGLNTSLINLPRLYELKLKSLQDGSEDQQRKMFVQMRMVMNRFERDRNPVNKGCKLEDFISIFPDSIGFFSDKLIASINTLSKELDQVDIFGDNCPENFKYVLNLFANESLKKTSQIEEAMLEIIRKHSTLFMKYAQSINWKNLDKNLKISEHFVFLQVANLLEDLRTNLVIKSISPEELCERFTSTNQQLINQVKLIDYVNILLKMKQNNPCFEFVQQIVELSLLMEQIQSISLNKIVAYQAGYSSEKIAQIKQLYLEKSEAVLHVKLQKTSSQLALTCWEIISQLDIQHINTFLKHYRIYFEAMKDTTDRNLILKLLKKTYRNIGDINNQKKHNFSVQLYYHNSEVINKVIDIILASIKTNEEIPEQNIVMGRSYLNFVNQCSSQGKNACILYNKIIIPHILLSIENLYSFILNGSRSEIAIFGNKRYSGQNNYKRVIKAVTADMIERISGRFSLESLNETTYFIIVAQRPMRFVSMKDLLEQRIQELSLLQENIELFQTKVSQQKIAKSYIEILRKIQQERYNQLHLKSLQSLFMTIVTNLSQKYSTPHQQLTMLNNIINQIDINEVDKKANEKILKMQCSWINEMLKKIKNLKIQQVLSQHFVQRFIKATVYMLLKDPVQYEESLQKSISILEKFIPRNLSENQAELVQFGQGLLQLIIKCIKPNDSAKNIDYEAVSSIASTVIMMKCPEFNSEIQVLLRILKEGNVKIGNLLCELVEKQTQLASMEADIKGLFLKESENLVDENQDKISVRLQTFINTFKLKYQDQVRSFSNITSKLVKKQIKKDQKKDVAFLCYDKSNSFSYSEVLKKDFFQYEPSSQIKLIIKDLLSGFNANLQRKNMANILDSLRDLFYYSPLIIPFVMLHPIQTQSGSCDFVDLLVTIVSSKKNESINKFLLFACLDHSSLHKIKDRTIFFSEYLCFRIIKQIIHQGINRHTLFVSYQLAQLKRFAYLCKIKLNRFEGKSLVSAIIDRLQSTREGFFYKTAENNIIYLLMAIIFKQDGIDNLKKCFIPKKPKEFDRDYKLINECLVPFNVYYRKQKFKGRFQTRQENIIFTGNLITPFYAELYQQIYMEEDYIIETPSYQTLPTQQSTMDVESNALFYQNFKEKHLKSLISLKKLNKYKDTEEELQTKYNSKHQQTAASINTIYFKDQQQEKQEKDDRFDMESSDQEIQQSINRRNRRNARGRRGAENNRNLPRGYTRGHMRNQRHVSRYAQQDFNNPGNQGQNNTLQAQFQQSLNIIASQQVLQEKVSTKFDGMKQHSEQIYSILNEINEKLFLMGKQAIKESELSGKSYNQCKQMLAVKQAQIDFDYNKIWMSPEEFEQYLQMSATRFSKLDESRREQVRHAEQRLLSFNLQRSASSDSINYIIDTIDQNFQHIHNINRTLSRSSLSSNNEEDIMLPQSFHFQNNMLSYRVFSDVNEKILFEMLLSFYYTCQKFSTKQFMPFLENKRIQSQLINTLLYLMRDPFNRKEFPNCYFEFIDDEDQLRWRKVEVDEANKDNEGKLFAERVMPIFESVKNYSFYQNDAFLLQEISTQGILGIQYEPKYPNQNNSYVPIKQILDYAFDMSAETTIQLLKGAKSLPDHQIEKIIEKLVLSETQKPAEEESSSVRFRRFARRLNRNITPYENIKQLSKNKVFKQKFRAVYAYGVKDPTSALLTQLIQSQIYSVNQLKEMHMKMLQNGKDDINSLIFFNKIVQIYTDEELENASWLKQYQDIIAQAIKCVRKTSAAKGEEEPILRILRLKNELGFQIKRAILEREINEKQRFLNFEYDEVQKTNLVCKKEKGIFLSTFEELRNNPDNFWLSPFNVRFINENGIRETGFGDGVRRQWFTILSKEMVNPNYLLFSRTAANYYFFNKESYINSRHLQYYEFIGKLFGYSLTKSSLLVSPSFSILLYKMILSEEITFEDILPQFKDERQHIEMLERMIKSVKNDEDLLDCDFKFTYIDKRLISSVNYSILANKKVEGQDQLFGKRVDTIYTTEKVIKELHSEEELKNLPQETNVVYITDILELKPGGADIKVTFDNMHEYLDLTKKKIYQLIVTSNKKKFQAFMAGFKRIINPKQLSRFNSRQLRQLVEGTSVIDMADIKKYTKNSDVDEKTAELLWNTVEKLSNADRGTFLWNWIGGDKMPVEGAKIMNLSISAAREKFIKAHTCNKSLEIPKCETEQQMQEAVTIAINNLKTGKAFLED